MKILSVDIETYSPQNLGKTGVYKYAADPEFEILLIAYAFDDEPVKLIDLASSNMQQLMPDMQTKETGDMEEFRQALRSPDIIKTAYNANFERTCLGSFFQEEMPPEMWRCTMVHAATLGLPGSLAKVGDVLGLEEDKKKLKTGKALIRYFCSPCKPTRTNGERTRNLPGHDPQKWEMFKDYCKRDVETEREIRKKLMRYPVPENEQKLWTLDQKINDHGILIDRKLVEQAIRIDQEIKEELETEAKKLTGLSNPNSVAQLKKWIKDRTGDPVASLNKAAIKDLKQETQDRKLERVLQIRQEMGKTSVTKYQALERAMTEDNRIRGILQFYGSRTGRWAGRIFQPQNLPRNKIPDLELARNLLKDGNRSALELLYGSVPEILSQLIRTALIAPKNKTFIVSDFSAIEARVIAWLANEKWRMKVFNTHGKIYEASASQMFKVPIEKITKDNPEYALRQKGKIAELALGYGGSVGALKATGALNMGLEEHELKPLVDTWRNSNPAITDLWWSVDAAAKETVRYNTVNRTHGLTFKVESGILFIELPNKRRLAYTMPRIEPDRWGRDGLTYEGIEQGRRSWGRIDTYGPKLVENIVQAIARDCLAHAMQEIEKEGYQIVLHVHDEVVIEGPPGELEKVNKILARVPSWAKGLPLKGAGFENPFYMKD